MAVQVSDATRFAIFTVWPANCVWCRRPLAYREMQIEHLIPKYLVDGSAADPEGRAKELAELIELHKLPEAFDLHSEENLAPSCGPCNSQKGDGRPPGVVGILLSRAAKYAGAVRRNAATTMSKQKFQNALGVLSTGDPSDPNFIDAVRGHRAEIEELLASLDVEASQVDLGAGLVASTLVGPGWRILKQHASGVEYLVNDKGTYGGYTGPGLGFTCPFCGNQGPWNGIVCLSCGQRSEPD